MTDRLPLHSIDHYVPEGIRTILEQRFWQTIEDGATVEALSGDETFALAPQKHPAFFADHGIVHARDVAAGVVELASIADGLLLPARSADRREFVTALGVLLVYVHDVGMHDPSPEGRRAHALYAAQLPFSGRMDDVLARLWESGGPVVRRIASVSAASPFRVADDVILRELVSLAAAHSKSTVPTALYAEFSGLRRALQQAVLVQFEEHLRAGTDLDPDGGLPHRLGVNAHWYDDPERDAFAWLDSRDSLHMALADDAVDAARLLRAADALRQRGTTLRTTAGYEIFIDADTGRTVFSVRAFDGDQLFLLRVDSPLAAGEANVRKAELTPNGDLRFSFHRGRFSSPAAAAVACEATARAVADIGTDVLGAFELRRPSPDRAEPQRTPGSMRVELERPADEPAFADSVASALARIAPPLVGRAVVVADLENASSAERARYLAGITISAESENAGEFVNALGEHGMRVAGIDRSKAFEDVRRVSVRTGEVLMEAGSPPAFVYIAIEGSLRIEQPGGYPDLGVPPWVPVGVTGVVRRAARSSKVVVAEPGEVLMIPGELFAREWFRPYEPGEFEDVLAEMAQRVGSERGPSGRAE